MVFGKKSSTEKVDNPPHTPDSGNVDMVEKMEPKDHGASGFAAYGHDHLHPTLTQAEQDDMNPNVHNKMNLKLALALTAMSFLWVGSQIPLYLFGSVLPLIYSDLGGASGRYLWMVVGYLIPLAAVCPFVGAFSDIFGRKMVGATGQLLLIIGPIVVSTAQGINVAVGGMVISGLGAGLNELIALAGTSEMVPVAKRGAYVGGVVFTILPFCASGLWAQLIAEANWRWNGLLISAWNLIGLVLLMFCYKEPPRHHVKSTKQILTEIDKIGAFLSISGVLLFMMGMQWGAAQYSWTSVHVLVPFVLGIVLIIAFFVWEFKFAKYPMVPAKVFSKDKRTMILILLMTFLSGGNFFAVLLFWPTQAHNMYSPDPLQVGVRTLPMGFGIIIGAVIALILIGLTKGRTKFLMIFWTVTMTAMVGLMSYAKVDNLSAVYAIIMFAAICVGGVIIPCSIIAQIICPTELIGTITAITLSIRYIGGAIGFTAYYNVLYAKFTSPDSLYKIVSAIGTENILADGNLAVLTDLVTYAGQAQYADLQNLIDTSPSVARKDVAFDIILTATQEAFALAYRWPYWISIAFGGACILCALGCRDVKQWM